MTDHQNTCTSAALARVRVAPDNNCLFTTAAYLCEDLTSELDLRAAARRLRAACADSVSADPDPDTRALLLGHDSVADYGAWIRVETHWGGEPEILMLAQHYNVQIVLASCETLRCSTYSADAPTASVFVLYTGQHYDPLVGQPAASDAGASPLRRLPLDAGVRLAASAIEIARAHNAEAERRKLERRVKRIKCGGCGAIVADNAAFQAHCTEVEHDDDFTYECEQVRLRASLLAPLSSCSSSSAPPLLLGSPPSPRSLSSLPSCLRPSPPLPLSSSPLEATWRGARRSSSCWARATSSPTATSTSSRRASRLLPTARSPGKGSFPRLSTRR